MNLSTHLNGVSALKGLMERAMSFWFLSGSLAKGSTEAEAASALALASSSRRFPIRYSSIREKTCGVVMK